MSTIPCEEVRRSARLGWAAIPSVKPQRLPLGEKEPRTPESPASILLAEDDEDMRDVLAHTLRKNGFLVTECRDGAELLRHLDGYLTHETSRDQMEHFDLIVTDIRMPGVFGLSVVEGAHQRDFFPPTFLMTAFPDLDIFQTAERCGVLAVFSKPFDVKDLVDMVRAELDPRSRAAP